MVIICQKSLLVIICSISHSWTIKSFDSKLKLIKKNKFMKNFFLTQHILNRNTFDLIRTHVWKLWFFLTFASRSLHCIYHLKIKQKKYLKHSTSYYNYFMFNLCITLFFTETSCFRCIFVSCCRFCVSRYFFSIPNLSIFVKWLPWKERDNHKNEATIYIMIIFNDNATFLLFSTTL